jgi:hypothetical protein
LFSRKHTSGEQLLEVRREKREREAFAEVQQSGERFEEGEEACDVYET